MKQRLHVIKQLLLEERTDNYVINRLPNEIIEMILFDVLKSPKNSIEIYVIFL